MSTAERLITADEFDELEEPEEGGKLELDEGRLCVERPVSFEHGEYQARISYALKGFADRHLLGRVSVEAAYRLEIEGADGDVTRAPDVSFLASSALPAREELRKPSLPVPPTLAVEVVSPSDRDVSIRRKVRQYLAAGVQRVWVVRPEEQTVTVHRAGRDARTYGLGDSLSSEDAAFEVEGLALSLDELFGDG